MCTAVTNSLKRVRPTWDISPGSDPFTQVRTSLDSTFVTIVRVTQPWIFLLLDRWSFRPQAILVTYQEASRLHQYRRLLRTNNMGKGKKAEDVLIDSRVSTTQCKLAVDALLKHALAHQAAKEQNELLPDRTEQYIWLVVAVKKMFPERKLKPFKMCVHYPLLPKQKSDHLVPK